MSTSIFSSLSRGYGSWTGSFDSVVENQDHLPSIDPDTWCHRHGFTVKPRASSAPVKVSVADSRCVDIPKTFLTRRGALVLFSAPVKVPQKLLKSYKLQRKKYRCQDILDCSLKLKTLERLSLSVLQYGHKNYEKETASVSDKHNPSVLKFLHDLDQEKCTIDLHSQPGRDVHFYLQDLKNKASNRKCGIFSYRTRSAELQGILQHMQQTLPHYTYLQKKKTTQGDSFTSCKETMPSILSANTARSRSHHKVLSSQKILASLKSLNDLNRQVSSGNLFDENDEMEEDSQWSGGKVEVSFRNRNLSTSGSEDIENENIDVGLIQLFHPPYSGGKVFRENTTISPAMSRIATPEVLADQHEVNIMSEEYRYASVDFLEETITKVDTLTSLHRGDQVIVPENMNERGNSFAGPYDLLITLENVAFTDPVESTHKTAPTFTTITASVETNDETVPTLTTLTALAETKDEKASIFTTLTAPVETTDETAPTLTKLTAPFETKDETTATLTAPVETKDETAPTLIMDEKLSPSKFDNEVVGREIEETDLPHPKTEESPQVLEIDMLGEEDRENEDVEVNEEDKNYKFSERVQKEKEEKEKKISKLKEDKQIAEAKKMEEEGERRYELEEKGKAAKERLKKLADEVTQRTIEQKKKQEEEARPGIMNEASLKPTPPLGKKISTSHGKVLWKGGKPVNKRVKIPLTSTDKHLVQVMDNISVHDAGKEKSELEETLAERSEACAVTDVASKDFIISGIHSANIRPEKKQLVMPDHLKEILSRKSDLQTREELEAEIRKMLLAVDGTLGEGVLQIEDSEGLSAQGFVLARDALLERIKKAEEQIQEDTPKADKVPRKNKLEKRAVKKRNRIDAEKKQELAMKRDAIKEQQKLEKQKRLEEVRQLQEKIILRDEAQKAQEAEAKRKAEELAERIESIRWEEEQIARTEAEARAQVAAVRRAQREEREIRRKIDLEYKKQAAIGKREKEKTVMEAARQKEQEMLFKIADAEMTRRLREEAETKREEEEMSAQERFEAEVIAAQKAAEEEEERFRDLERQAEEEAFQRLSEEKEAAEKQRWELEKQRRIMKEEEERRKQEFLEEENKLKEEIRQKEEEEKRRMEQEREKLRELQRIEEEARKKMQSILEQRRVLALRRREYNLNARANLDVLRQSQGFTNHWTFTYFVKWPRESYMRLMGQDPKKKKVAALPRPQPQVLHPSANAEASTTVPSTIDVSTVQS